MRDASVAKGFDGSAASIQQLVIGSIGAYDVDLNDGTFEDGSGESNHDLLPPRAMVDLIGKVFSDKNLVILKKALPVAGQSGTLASRFSGDAAVARGHVTAKTGWINGVYALAGQIDAKRDTINVIVVARGKVTATAMPAIDNLVAAMYSCGANLASY
jgi:D-alanyl-D-alanine carboxypeptidase/D-alanyl-D-alanine-endopeptidase (penicillin-binding protein 4)